MSDEELKVQDTIVNSLIDHYKTVIEQYKAENSEDKIIRQTLENFMRGLWEEIQVGELEYTTSEVYEMLEREIFTDNHVDISSKNTEAQGDDRWLLHFGQNMAIPSAEPKTGHCEDCKHFRKLPYHTDTFGKCIHHTGFYPKGNWYCADYEIVEL